MAADVASWDVEDVERWLVENGFSRYVDLLCKEHKIDGMCLLNLTERDLREAPMQIKVLGDVKRLWLSIVELRKTFQLSIKGASSQFRFNTYSKRTEDLSDGRIFSDSDSEPESSEIIVRLSRIGDFGRSVSAIVYCVVVLIITALTMTIVHDQVPDMNRYPPLPDIFLDNIPLIPWAFYMCEICATLMGFIACLIIFFHKHRLIVIRRVCAISGTVFLLRCVTMFVTSLSVPGVHLECTGKIYGSWEMRLRRAFTIFFGGGLALNGVRSCGDYMYSGHTCAITLLNFFVSEYTPRRWTFLHTFCWILNVFGIFFILAAHEHYSIDVFIAFYISSRIFLYYHALANAQTMDSREKFRTRFWFPLFWFFESNCKFKGPVPNEYEWPIAPFWKAKTP
ncbi:sphingomyelin synthase-related protein 1-like [Xenia sp. Carnegie-2017]|uniref:sphingomyelin synthase-related protein 1-like n=1 Tax=Xenia sp. Carnegie-2017 TaxID=2897299 RepID=UPI001F04D3C4|nr:sphingomyelin synthase-related protein 1-like [Xenia sp. Carnegie-2017]